MNEHELNNQAEANDFAGELSDEALDRAEHRDSTCLYTNGGCSPGPST